MAALPLAPSTSVAPVSMNTPPAPPCTPAFSVSVPPLARTVPLLPNAGATVPKPLTSPTLGTVGPAKLPPAICSVAPAALLKLPVDVKLLALPTCTTPALPNAPGVVKLRPFWTVKLPAAVLAAKLLSALALLLALRSCELAPSSRMVAALVTMLALANCRMPGPKTW